MEINFTDILPYLVSVVTGIAGWLTGRRKRKNDFLIELQSSIDLLAKENAELVEKVILMNKEIIELRKENAQLRVEVEELNEKLSNVKTITKKI
jgi:cell division protein FtsB